MDFQNLKVAQCNATTEFLKNKKKSYSNTARIILGYLPARVFSNSINKQERQGGGTELRAGGAA